MFLYPIYNHNWRNISAIYIYNKTSIKRNILTIKQNTSGRFWCSYILFIIIIGEILVLFIYIYNKTSIKRNILTIKQNTSGRFWCSYILFIIIIGEILVLFIYITRLASNEIFSPSNKIHREVGRAKDLSAPPVYRVSTRGT